MPKSTRHKIKLRSKIKNSLLRPRIFLYARIRLLKAPSSGLCARKNGAIVQGERKTRANIAAAIYSKNPAICARGPRVGENISSAKGSAKNTTATRNFQSVERITSAQDEKISPIFKNGVKIVLNFAFLDIATSI